jgi:hypothetical protein
MGFGSRVGSIDCGDGEEENDSVSLTERASAIVLAMQDEKWQAQEERILRALSEVYREGFMDGEAGRVGTGEDYPEDVEIEGACV